MAAQTYVLKSPCFAIFAYFAVKSAKYLSTFLYLFMRCPSPYPACRKDAGRGNGILMLLFISIAKVSIGLVIGAKLMMPFQSCDKFCNVANVFL
jgi:hypothetical protein